MLAGKCRACKENISLRYPVVEAVNALFYAAVLWRFGMGWHTLFYFAFVSALIVITFIDLDFQIIPDSITLPGILIGLIAGSFLLYDPFLRWSLMGFKTTIIGAVTGFGLFYLIAVLSRGGMGGGDIKMMAMAGALMGWKSVLLTTFLGSLFGSVWGIFLMVFKEAGERARYLLARSLQQAPIITLFAGQEIFTGI